MFRNGNIPTVPSRRRRTVKRNPCEPLEGSEKAADPGSGVGRRAVIEDEDTLGDGPSFAFFGTDMPTGILRAIIKAPNSGGFFLFCKQSNSNIALFEICTGPLPLPLGEVSRSDGEGKWHHRHPLNFRDNDCITKSFVGNGLVPFRCTHHRHPYEFRFIEQTEGMVGTKASP